MSEWLIKQDPTICCLQKTQFRFKITHKMKVKGWKTIFHTNSKLWRAGVAIFISDKIDLKSKTVTRDKGRYYIMIKGSIH